MRSLPLGATPLAAFIVLSSTLSCSAPSPSGGTDAPPSGAGGSGNVDGTGGEASSPVVVTPGSYALPPPDQCINKYDHREEGCVDGDAGTLCGGLCTPPSAGHNEGKSGELGYMCPRNMLFSAEMEQAAIDDANTYSWPSDSEAPFTYAVVGHDNDGGILDGPNGQSVCCQCYQLIPYIPESQLMVDGVPSIPLPKPMVVQAFNTGASAISFDVYMGAGGTGAVKGCFEEPNGKPFYSAYPSVGQDTEGGVKAVGNPGNETACKTEHSLVTPETLNSSGCQDWIAEGCNQIEHSVPALGEQARDSCIKSNQSDNYYHMNWEVYAKRVACPAAITQVTGCKLVEDLPAADPSITADNAVANGFITGYHTTTMEDCAKPTCAARDWVNGNTAGVPHVVDGDYNSFYTCNQAGIPWTQ